MRAALTLCRCRHAAPPLSPPPPPQPETDNELSTFYHSDEDRARLEAAAAAAPAQDHAATRKQRLQQYQEAVAEGWALQDKLPPAAPHLSTVDAQTVLADVERHAVPVPAAELAKFRELKASLVDEKKYYRLKGMA